MKNKEITFYELMGLIKDNKAPEKIKYDNEIYVLNGHSYWNKNKDDYLFRKISTISDDDIINLKVEILPEENDEWEDIDFENYSIAFSENDIDGSFRDFSKAIIYNKELIEKLIKNQKYLKERLEEK